MSHVGELTSSTTYNVARQIMSTVACCTIPSNSITFPDLAVAINFSLKTCISSRKPGNSAVKFLAEKPGLKTLRQSFHSGPSMATISLALVKGLSSRRIEGDFGSDVSWVNCDISSGAKTAANGWPKGQGSRYRMPSAQISGYALATA